MGTLPFETYPEAVEYFGVKIPPYFFETIQNIDVFCNKNEMDTLDTLDDLFGIARLEGDEARYHQTPIELYPFGSMGADGVHYGFVVHTLGEDDYPSGELCPMDSDGVILIGKNTPNLFQNLLRPRNVNKYSLLVKHLNLDPIIGNKNRYDSSGNGLKVTLDSKPGWKHVNTSDGVGVFAEEEYFSFNHEHVFFAHHHSIENYESLADDMRKKSMYASQLFYLKELFWQEWTDRELAKKYLHEMLAPYEQLNREHLYLTTKNRIAYFDETYEL